jgi:hypothetical protein
MQSFVREKAFTPSQKYAPSPSYPIVSSHPALPASHSAAFVLNSANHLPALQGSLTKAMKKIAVIDAEKDAREVLRQEKFLQALGGRVHAQDC